MSDLRKAAQQALEALEKATRFMSYSDYEKLDETIDALRAALAEPQMQPCAGRNCGSTNPNLHSAECFEDYEKSTGMNQWQGLTDVQEAILAEREAIAQSLDKQADLAADDIDRQWAKEMAAAVRARSRK